MKRLAIGFALVAVGAVVIGGSSGCGGDGPVAQVGLTTQLGPGASAPFSDCGLATQAPLKIGDPDSNMIKDGVDNTDTSCSVVPSGGAFDIKGTARLTGGTNHATFSVSGKFTAPDPKNVGATTMTGITMTVQIDVGAFKATDCTADYTYFEPIDRSGTPMTNAGVAAGRVWGTVRCARAANTNTTNQTNKACETRATFRFENCTQQGTN